ncbi:hypothetical protein Goklo_021655, partial [Gossypium klotzschianum]|nr:hypothetical protein [Gossypium klotzschianum]
RNLYEKYKLEFEEGGGALNPQQIEEDLFNHITGSFQGKQIIYNENDELQENDSAFLQSGTIQYQARDRSSKEQ